MKLKEWYLVFAWLIALTGTLMSLFYTAIVAKEPCYLCWYQRVALFPLAVQLGISAYRGDRSFALYTYPLCFFGFATAIYQALLAVWPEMHSSCGINGGDCVSKMPHIFEIPFPWISALGFLLIALLLRANRFETDKL